MNDERKLIPISSICIQPLIIEDQIELPIRRLSLYKPPLSPYSSAMTSLHIVFSSVKNLQYHLERRTRFFALRLWTPNVLLICRLRLYSRLPCLFYFLLLSSPKKPSSYGFKLFQSSFGYLEDQKKNKEAEMLTLS